MKRVRDRRGRRTGRAVTRRDTGLHAVLRRAAGEVCARAGGQRRLACCGRSRTTRTLFTRVAARAFHSSLRQAVKAHAREGEEAEIWRAVAQGGVLQHCS